MSNFCRPGRLDTRQIPCWIRLLRDIHNAVRSRRTAPGFSSGTHTPENPYPACALRDFGITACTNSGHPAVDTLHLAENKSDKSAHFLLT